MNNNIDGFWININTKSKFEIAGSGEHYRISVINRDNNNMLLNTRFTDEDFMHLSFNEEEDSIMIPENDINFKIESKYYYRFKKSDIKNTILIIFDGNNMAITQFMLYSSIYQNTRFEFEKMNKLEIDKFIEENN